MNLSSWIQEFSRRTLNRFRRPALVLVPVFLLSSCAVGPNYKRPNVTAPPAFRGGPDVAQQASFADLPWWEIFHDATLTGLIKESLANNQDLSVAVGRVEE